VLDALPVVVVAKQLQLAGHQAQVKHAFLARRKA